MKILAFNGSPRAGSGNTEKILRPFLDGARGAGAQAETLYLKDLRVGDCQGCYARHAHTPGSCAVADDMAWVSQKMLDADVLVFATPLYVFSMTASMKALLDRMLVFSRVDLQVVDGALVHPPVHPEKTWNWVVIANAGFPEPENFSALAQTFRRFAFVIGAGRQVRIGGMILRGMGGLFEAPAMLARFQWFFAACRQAGEDMVRKGAIDPATQAVLDRPLLEMGLEAFAQLSNALAGSLHDRPPAGLDKGQPV